MMLPNVMDHYRRGETGSVDIKLALGTSLARTLPPIEHRFQNTGRRRTLASISPSNLLVNSTHLFHHQRKSDFTGVLDKDFTPFSPRELPLLSPRDSVVSLTPRSQKDASLPMLTLTGPDGLQLEVEEQSLNDTKPCYTERPTSAAPRKDRHRRLSNATSDKSSITDINQSPRARRRRGSIKAAVNAARSVRRLRHYRRRHSHHILQSSGFYVMSKSGRIQPCTPIEKFRRVANTVRVVTGICVALKRRVSGERYIKKKGSHEWSLVEMQLYLQADFNRLLAFNPQSYSKAPLQKGGEKLRRILSTPFQERSMEHIQVIMTLLRGNISFEDYPVHTQVQLCRCMIFQSYEARRIIVKEGHPPAAFYIILSGTVLINVRETHPTTGKTFVRTVHQMSEGEGFGEIALINGTCRTSTVVCKTDVELLVIMKEDFDVIIKEPLERQRDMHIEYCRNMELFKDFPCEVFTTAMNQFFYQYFKKDMVVVKDSRRSNYIVVIKSGMCKVVMSFKEVSDKKKKNHQRDDFFVARDMEEAFPLYTDKLKREKLAERSKSTLDTQTDELRDVMKANLMTGITDTSKIAYVPKDDVNFTNKRGRRGLRRSSTLSNLYEYLESEQKKNSIGVVLHGDGFWSKHLGKKSRWQNRKEPAHDRFGATPEQIQEQDKQQTKQGIGRTWKRVTAAATAVRTLEIQSHERENHGKVSFAQLAELGEGGVFGLETMLQKSTKSFSLVSDGAECILISKKLFLKEANAKVLRVVSDLVMSYPSTNYVKQEIHRQRNWEKYKAGLVNEILCRKKP